MEELKKQAKALGIWNLFLPFSHGQHRRRFSNLEYGLMAEQLGKSPIASEVWIITFFSSYFFFLSQIWIMD
jgi:acyl-CoA dehydrogenase